MMEGREAGVVGDENEAGSLGSTLADRLKPRQENFAKTIIFLPMAISLIGAATVWRFVYDAQPKGEHQVGVRRPGIDLLLHAGPNLAQRLGQVLGVVEADPVSRVPWARNIGAASRRTWFTGWVDGRSCVPPKLSLVYFTSRGRKS